MYFNFSRPLPTYFFPKTRAGGSLRPFDTCSNIFYPMQEQQWSYEFERRNFANLQFPEVCTVVPNHRNFSMASPSNSLSGNYQSHYFQSDTNALEGHYTPMQCSYHVLNPRSFNNSYSNGEMFEPSSLEFLIPSNLFSEDEPNTDDSDKENDHEPPVTKQ